MKGTLVMGDIEPDLAKFYNQERSQVEGLEQQPSHKTFNLQLVLSAECSRTRVLIKETRETSIIN